MYIGAFGKTFESYN